MNKAQTIISLVAVVLFILSLPNLLLSASWEVNTGHSGYLYASPIWSPPGKATDTATLQVGRPIIEWLAIGIPYGLLMFMFKTKKK